MKVILLILVIALGGLSVYFKTSAAGQIAEAQLAVKNMKTELLTAQGEAREAVAKSDQLTRDLEAANQRIASLDLAVNETRDQARAEIDSLTSTEAKEAARLAAQSAEEKAAREGSANLSVRLAEMKRIYDQHLTGFNAQNATLKANLQAAKTARETKVNNPPKFIEQGKKSTNNGTVATGVRMSQADREEFLAKHAAEIAELDAQISSIEAARIALEARVSELESAYTTAVAKARAEASISDLQGQ